jgi:hypothetical protein
MAAVPVTLSVVIYPRNKTDAPYPATLVGYAWVTGLEVGGGPIVSPPVEPPIDPPPPETPLDELLTAVAKEPPASGGWGWFPEYGWMYKPGPGGAAPKTLSSR